jgi:hypothetical protein
MRNSLKKLISLKVAGNILLGSLAVLFVFDILLLLRVIPATMVWGGQISEAANNLVPLEVTALVVTLVFAVIIAAKMEYIHAGRFKLGVTVGVWIIFAYLILNTIGNLASGVRFENLIFAPITVILAFCALRLAIE